MKKLRPVILTTLILGLLVAVILIVQNYRIKTIVAKVNQLIARYDDQAVLDYKGFRLQGLLSVNKLLCKECVIKGKNDILKIFDLKLNITDAENIAAEIKKITYSKGDEASNKTLLAYEVIFDDPVNIDYKKSDNQDSYTAKLPQSFLFNSPYESYKIQYKKPDNLLQVKLQNNLLQHVEYEDDGVEIFAHPPSNQQQEAISTTEKNMVKIVSDIIGDEAILSAVILSENNKFFDQVTNSYQDFNFNMNIEFAQNNNAPNSRKLMINNFKITSQDINFSLAGQVETDQRNIIPYGSVTLNIKQYEQLVEVFLRNIENTNLTEEMPQFFTSIKKNRAVEQEKIIKFMTKINNQDSADFTLNVARKSQHEIFFNNLPYQAIMESFNDIYGN